MYKFLRTFLLCSFLTVILTVYAYAAEDTLKVGLYYGSNALFSANLQNEQGSGYSLGWFDETTRAFTEIGQLGVELLGIAAVGAFTFASSALVWLILKKTMGIRVSREEELQGLDIG